MSVILRLLFFFLLLSAVRWLLGPLLRGRFRGVRPGPGNRGQQSRSARVVSGHMHKDPLCGMYVADDLALKLDRDGGTLYFCSQSCQDKYLESLKQVSVPVSDRQS